MEPDVYAWPDTIPYKVISKALHEYDQQASSIPLPLRRIHHDLYYGSEDFDANKDYYLDRRMNECNDGRTKNLLSAGDTNIPTHHAGSGGSIAASLRERRLAISRYKSPVKGKLQDILSIAMKSPPRITEHDTQSEPDQKLSLTKEASGYWGLLNRDADGHGRDLAIVVADAIKSIILHGRGYLFIHFPSDGGTFLSRRDQRAGGGLDANIRALDANEVDYWEYDDNGTPGDTGLALARVYQKRKFKENPWDTDEKTEEVWTYYTRSQMARYVLVVKEGENRSNANVALSYVSDHDLGICPIVPLQSSKDRDLWLMDALRSTILSHYNRDANLAWSLNQMAFSLLILRKDGDVNESTSVDPETGALIGYSGSFAAPDTQIFDAQSADLSRLEAQIDEILRTAALSAHQRDTQGRQSGVAKFREFSAVTGLALSYAMRARDALEVCIKAIKRIRGEEDAQISLDGLDEVDIQAEDIFLNRAERAMSVAPGKAFEHYKRWQVQMRSLINAPSWIRSRVTEEANARLAEQVESPLVGSSEVNIVVEDGDEEGDLSIRQPKTKLASQSIRERI